MSSRSPQILWVGLSDPWSPWTLSGISRAICAELDRRKLLLGAVDPNALSLRHARGPRALYKLERRLSRATSSLRRSDHWGEESQGVVGRALRHCPPDTRVVYALARPQFDPSLPIKRYRWMDMSLDDGVRTGSFGFDRMTAAQVEAQRHDEQRFLAGSAGVVTLSTYAAEAISRDLGFSRSKITPIGAGPAVEADMHAACTPERYAAAKVLFVGRDWERKGGPLVVEAVRKLRETLQHATLTVVGLTRPPSCNADFVEFVGMLDKSKPRDGQRLAELFKGASAFCMASSSEPWGLVYVEAQQAGLPVIGFRDWALPDIVEDGVTGELSIEHDADGLARALLRALSDPGRAASQGRRAQQRVNDVLGWPHVVDRLLSRVLPEAMAGRTSIPMQPDKP
jgi:glycosyltransferase involved in cell wall biosynthesis